MKPMTAIAALTLSLPGVAQAQESASQETMPATPHQEEAVKEVTSELFGKLDQDRNDLVSRTEAESVPALSESWTRYDENGDGSLDATEFSAFEQSSAGTAHTTGVAASAQTETDMPATPHQEEALQQELVDRLDRNGDGVVSRQEADAEASVAADWNRLDKNRDGRLDEQELTQSRQ